MAAIKLTVKQIMNLGLWDKVCEYKGWNTWILNEGRIDENELVEFDDEFKKETQISYHEAIEYINDDGKVKVIFMDDEIKYLDKLTRLDGIRFRDLFDACFYINY